jgi:hypothetical protein
MISYAQYIHQANCIKLTIGAETRSQRRFKIIDNHKQKQRGGVAFLMEGDIIKAK